MVIIKNKKLYYLYVLKVKINLVKSTIKQVTPSINLSGHLPFCYCTKCGSLIKTKIYMIVVASILHHYIPNNIFIRREKHSGKIVSEDPFIIFLESRFL